MDSYESSYTHKKGVWNILGVFYTHERNEKLPLHSVLTMNFLTENLILGERRGLFMKSTSLFWTFTRRIKPKTNSILWDSCSPETDIQIAIFTLRENDRNVILSENHEWEKRVRGHGCHLFTGKLEFWISHMWQWGFQRKGAFPKRINRIWRMTGLGDC